MSVWEARITKSPAQQESARYQDQESRSTDCQGNKPSVPQYWEGGHEPGEEPLHAQDQKSVPGLSPVPGIQDEDRQSETMGRNSPVGEEEASSWLLLQQVLRPFLLQQRSLPAVPGRNYGEWRHVGMVSLWCRLFEFSRQKKGERSPNMIKSFLLYPKRTDQSCQIRNSDVKIYFLWWTNQCFSWFL